MNLTERERARHSTYRPTAEHPLMLFLVALPFVVGLYPSLALLAATSQVPVLFGAYSRNLLFLNIGLVGSYAGFLLALWRKWRSLQFSATLLLCLLMFVATNNAVRDLTALEATTQVVRLAGGISMIVVAFLADKNGGVRWSSAGLGLGAVILIVALIDLAYSTSSRLFAESQSRIYGQYRTAMDLSNVGEQDIVLVGDSFVWGSGVPVEQRFGDVLERRLGGPPERVFSLGVIGAGVGNYNSQILDVPAGKKVRQVIVCFYANDMAPRQDLRDTLSKISEVVARRSFTLRALADLGRLILTPTAETYAQTVLDGYRADDDTFNVRWKLFEKSLRTLHQRAVERSRKPPALVILPMLVDFRSMSFNEPHRRVADLARQIGFQVLDTTPTFRHGKKAEYYRAASNDLHLNARGNEVVADILERMVRGEASGSSP